MKIKKQILFLFSALLLFACGGDDGGGAAPAGGNEFLNVSNIDIKGDKTSATLNIQASPNCEWTVSCGESWVSNIAPSSGRGSQSVTITLSGVNPSSTLSRTANIIVRNSSGSITRNVMLTQAANGEYLEISGESVLTFTNKAESHEVMIRSNTHWTVSITGNTEWISVTPMESDNDGRIIVSVKDNTTSEERTAIVTIKGSGVSKELTVKQAVAAAPIVALPTVSNISLYEATVSFSYSSELPVTSCGICYSTTANAPNIDNNSSIAATTITSPVEIKMTGLTPGTTYYVFSYVITAAGVQYSEGNSFTTVEEYIELSADKTLNIPYKGDTRTVNIFSNTHWSVSITGDTDGITINPMEGENNGSIIITATENSTYNSKQATLTISSKGGKTVQLTIVQAGANIPNVSIPEVSDIKLNEATISFNFESVLSIASCGICYSTTSQYPDIVSSSVIPSTTVESPVKIKMTGLLPGITYYVRAYVKGFASSTPYYSAVKSFTTSKNWPGEGDVVTPN